MLVAALRDLQVGKMSACGHKPLGIRQGQGVDVLDPDAAFSLQCLLYGIHDLVVRCGAQHFVHFRYLLQDLLLVSLGQAAGDNKRLQSACLFVFCHLQDGLDALLLGIMDETAGVDDDHISPGLIVRHLVALVCQQADHNL